MITQHHFMGYDITYQERRDAVRPRPMPGYL